MPSQPAIEIENLSIGRIRCLSALAGIALSALGSLSAWADPSSDFYKGKTVSIIVGFSSGGGYDIWARLIARHLPTHIPGSPNVVVENMPGAGGLTAVNDVYNTAPQDGTVIAATSNFNPFAPLLGIKEDASTRPNSNGSARQHKTLP